MNVQNIIALIEEILVRKLTCTGGKGHINNYDYLKNKVASHTFNVVTEILHHSKTSQLPDVISDRF